jgi:TM2 domain-containing membrane protein YozV
VVAERDIPIGYLLPCFLLSIPASLLFSLLLPVNSLMVKALLFGLCIGGYIGIVALYIEGTYETPGAWGRYWSGYWVSLFPLTPMELMDTRKRSVTTSLSPEDARSLCLSVLRMFPSYEPLETKSPEFMVAARLDPAATILIAIADRSTGQTEIVIEGWMTDHPYLQYRDNLRVREQATRQVIRILDRLHNLISQRASAIITGTRPVWDTLDVRIAAALSVLSPGLGQHYCGRRTRGMMFLALTGVGIIFFLVPGILMWLCGIADAALLARQVNEAKEPLVPVPHILLVMQAIASVTVIVGSVLVFLMIAFGVDVSGILAAIFVYY